MKKAITLVGMMMMAVAFWGCQTQGTTTAETTTPQPTPVAQPGTGPGMMPSHPYGGMGGGQ